MGRVPGDVGRDSGGAGPVPGTSAGRGEATVKTHVERILAKLGVRDRTQAVIAAYETGLVEPGAAWVVSAAGSLNAVASTSVTAHRPCG
jgi:hypothetical protein